MLLVERENSMSNRKLVLNISMSVDGFLATKDDGLDRLSVVEKEGEDYGYTEFMKTVDTYIVGRNTYNVVLKLTGGEFPHAKSLDCYVLTRQERESENGVQFYNGNIETLVQDLKAKEGKGIYCDGGAEVVQLLMEKDLIDEYIISVIPIMLGDGKRLFKGGVEGLNLKALPSKQYDSGLVQLHYERRSS